MRSILLAAALGMVGAAAAQVCHGGLPMEWGSPAPDRSQIPIIDLGPLPEEEATAPVPGFRYGCQRPVQADVLQQGLWRTEGDGSRWCRLALRSPGAVMLSVQFDRWELGPGDAVFLYDAARTRFIGGFDASNRQDDGTMATAVLPGDELVIEYRPGGEGRSRTALRVGSITHGIVDLFGFRGGEGAERDIDPGYQSAPCHININCPEAAGWQDHKRSVALFLRPDGGGCTGNLMNNTQSPRKPYFQLAQHCYVANTSGWVFYFNYEAPACVGSVGPSDQTLTGCTLRAGDYYRDLLLVELSAHPPPAYNAYYAGWDRSGATPQSGTTIQHPLYDVKKIAFDTDPSTSYTDAIGVQSWRCYWNQGLVQAVSSGAPLFDQNKRFVGHMYDGAQVCTTATSLPTDFAKFGPMWDGPSPSQRMRDWLNPANDLLVLDGTYGGTANVLVSLRAFLEGPFDPGSGLMGTALRAQGLVPLAEPYTAMGYAHAGGGGGEAATPAALAVTGPNAIVDWVVVELRSAGDPGQVVATRSALLQADGDVVSAADGSSPVALSAGPGSYFVAVRHRNHLGIMSAAAIALGPAATAIDLSNGMVPLYGGAAAAKPMGGRNVLYAGDADPNGILRYSGTGNDRDPILVRIGGTVPTATATGYFPEDVNLDGVVRYTGPDNDRDPILLNIGGNVPTATRSAQLP